MLKYWLAKAVCAVLDPYVRWQNTRLWYWSLRTILHHELPPEKRVMYLHGNRSVILKEQQNEKREEH